MGSAQGIVVHNVRKWVAQAFWPGLSEGIFLIFNMQIMLEKDYECPKTVNVHLAVSRA